MIVVVCQVQSKEISIAKQIVLSTVIHESIHRRSNRPQWVHLFLLANVCAFLFRPNTIPHVRPIQSKHVLFTTQTLP
jgi:hypothetical protein